MPQDQRKCEWSRTGGFRAPEGPGDTVLMELSGNCRAPSAPSRTYLCVQQGLPQWNRLLGLAAFVIPKPLPEETQGNSYRRAPGRQTDLLTDSGDVLLQAAQQHASALSLLLRKALPLKDKPQLSKQDPKHRLKAAPALPASPQRSEGQPSCR